MSAAIFEAPTDVPEIMVTAMARRHAAGLYVEVTDPEAAKVAEVGVLSIYAKDEAQRDAYVASLESRGVAYAVSAKVTDHG